MKPLKNLLLLVLLVMSSSARPQSPQGGPANPNANTSPSAQTSVPRRNVQQAAKKTQPPASVSGRTALIPVQPIPQRGKAFAPAGLPSVAPAPPPSMLYGVEVAWENLFANGTDQHDSTRAGHLLDLMQKLGVTNTRIHIAWTDVEPERGRYNWRRTDTLIRLVKSHGFVITCLVDSTPSWARNPDPALQRLLLNTPGNDPGRVLPPLPEYLPDLGHLANVLGNRYKTNVHRWELWNEPDGAGLPQVTRASGNLELRLTGDPGTYVRMLRAFSINIKRADPSCLVGIGGLSTPTLAFLQALYADGAQNLFDAICLHPAMPAGPLRLDWLDACYKLTLMHEKGNSSKKVWVTSWGWATYPGTPDGIVEGEQARLVRNSIAAMSSRPYIDMACLETLNDWEATHQSPPSLVSTGLCSRDLQPKPALQAFEFAARHVQISPVNLHQVGPTASVPAALASSPVRVDVDASDIIGRFPNFWRGLQLSTEEQKLLSNARWLDTAKGVVSAGASLVRLTPFRPGTVAVAEDGTPVVSWEGPDALLRSAHRGGMGIVLDVNAPASLSERAWRNFVAAATRRYSAPAYGIVRWELSAGSEIAVSRYIALVQAVKAAAPGVSVGFNLRDADSVAAARRFFTSISLHIPVDSLGFQASPDPDQTARTVCRLRAFLATIPERANTLLFPDLSLSDDHGQLEAANRLVALAARLYDYGPADHPNSVIGTMAPLISSVADGYPTEIGNALTLLNRIAGARLRVTEESSAVRCLAARTAGGLAVLVWSEPQTERDGNVLTLLRLRNLPLPHEAGWRITRRIADLPTQTSGPISAGANPIASSFNIANFRAAVADAPADGNLELPLVLSPSMVTLITLEPHHQTLQRSIDLSVEASNPVVIGGLEQDVFVQIHNGSTKPQTIELQLSGSHTDLVPTGISHFTLRSIPPGTTRRLRYPLTSPVTGEDTQAWVNVQAKCASGGERRAAVLWQTLTPLTATLATPRVDFVPGKKVSIRLLLTNRRRAPLPITLSGVGALLSFTLPVGDAPVTRELEIMPSNLGEGIHPVGLHIESQGVLLDTVTVWVGVPTACRYALTPPTIDGDLSDWQDAPMFGMGREDQWHGRAWGGPEDFSAIAYARWDEQNFYFACAVTQAQFTPPASVAEMAERDSVLFALSSSVDRQAVQRGYRAGDQELGLALIGGTKPVVYRYAGGAEGIVAAKIAIRRIANRTFYEAAIPWTELLPAPPKPDQTLGFSVLVKQGDGQAQGSMEWGGGILGEKRPDLFPPLRLEK